MNTWRLVVNVLAAIGAVALVVGVIVFLCGNAIFGGTDSPSVQETLLSPNGAFRAMRVASSGGGAAGWCREFIVINPASTTPSIPTYLEANDGLVFSAQCNATFTMQWNTPNQLVIRYKLPLTALSEIEIRPTDKASNVSIRFEPEA